MSRHVDPIWLYENVQEQAPQFAETLKDLILVAPSIDIVRCGECKHWWEIKGANYGDCDHFALDTKAYDYCSYGERSSE